MYGPHACTTHIHTWSVILTTICPRLHFRTLAYCPRLVTWQVLILVRKMQSTKVCFKGNWEYEPNLQRKKRPSDYEIRITAKRWGCIYYMQGAFLRNPHNNPRKQVLLLYPFYSEAQRGQSNWLKVIWRRRNWAPGIAPKFMLSAPVTYLKASETGTWGPGLEGRVDLGRRRPVGRGPSHLVVYSPGPLLGT